MSDTQFLSAAESERPLQCVGAVNAYHALLAEACGFNALYLSVLRRITDVTTLPVLVDIDTG